MEIQALSLNLERAKWIIRYLELRNKQLEDYHEIMELQNIRENRKATQHRRIELTPLEKEKYQLQILAETSLAQHDTS